MQNVDELKILNKFIDFTPLDIRNIFTSDATPTMAPDTTTLSSNSLKTATYTTEGQLTENNVYFNDANSTEYFVRDDVEVESSTYAKIQ